VPGFFVHAGVVDRVHQYMGNLFYRKVPPSEIKEMPYRELKYWSDWHDTLNKCVEDSITDA